MDNCAAWDDVKNVADDNIDCLSDAIDDVGSELKDPSDIAMSDADWTELLDLTDKNANCGDPPDGSSGCTQSDVDNRNNRINELRGNTAMPGAAGALINDLKEFQKRTVDNEKKSSDADDAVAQCAAGDDPGTAPSITRDPTCPPPA